MTLFAPPIIEEASFLPKRSIGGFTATVTIDEDAIDEMAITSFPVQQGADVTDHAYRKPAELKISILQSSEDMPLTEAYQKLRDMMESAEPMDVVTGKRAYKNMLINTVHQTTTAATENSLSVLIALREVNIVTLEVVTVPAREKQAEPGTTDATKKVGKKSPKKQGGDAAGAGDAGADQKRSALAALFGK